MICKTRRPYVTLAAFTFQCAVLRTAYGTVRQETTTGLVTVEMESHRPAHPRRSVDPAAGHLKHVHAISDGSFPQLPVRDTGIFSAGEKHDQQARPGFAGVADLRWVWRAQMKLKALRHYPRLDHGVLHTMTKPSRRSGRAYQEQDSESSVWSSYRGFPSCTPMVIAINNPETCIVRATAMPARAWICRACDGVENVLPIYIPSPAAGQSSKRSFASAVRIQPGATEERISRTPFYQTEAKVTRRNASSDYDKPQRRLRQQQLAAF